jgi:hypothetical protein
MRFDVVVSVSRSVNTRLFILQRMNYFIVPTHKIYQAITKISWNKFYTKKRVKLKTKRRANYDAIEIFK